MIKAVIDTTLRDMDVGTARQWALAGISAGRLRTMVARGELVRQRHGTYATASAVAAVGDDPAHRHALAVRAALASTSAAGAVASHESAALVHDLPLLNAPPPGVVSLTRPPGSRRGRSASDVRYYSAGLPSEHVTTRHGTPVTTPARTVIDLARALPYMDGVVVADAAIHKLKAGKSELATVVAACSGWPGADQARRVVDFSTGLSGSPLESCARVTFDAFRLPPPELQTQILGGVRIDGAGRITVEEYHEYKVDFLWRKFKTVAEADGLMKYSSGEAAINERKRDRLIREAGYKVVHLTWAELLGRPERVVNRIIEAFRSPSVY
jgi:very-short-patch-repair endonuclease